MFGSLQGYRRAWIRADVVAGLTVWAVLVPEALAYATIAGVPPVVGLYAAIPSLVLYAAAGSSRHLVVGPMSATAALSAATVAPFAGGDSALYVALTAALAVVTGIAGLLAGLLRLGFIASFISEPVLKGFIVGLALTIMIGQVPKFFGVPKSEGDFFEQTWGLITHLGDTQTLTLLVGAASLAVVLACKKWFPLVPGSLLAVLLGTAASVMFGLQDRGVEIVGEIDSGLPDFGLPDAGGLSSYLDLAGPAVAVLIVGFAEGLGAAKTYAAKAGYQISANRELVGLGAANLGSGLCAGMVVNGSLSKTAVNGAAGARSQVSGLVVAVLTLITLLFLTGLFEELPEATLSAVVIAAVIELVDFPALRRLYRVWTDRLGSIYGFAARADFAAAIAAMLGVLIFDTLPGLVIGIGGVDVAVAVPGLPSTRGRSGQAGRGLARRGTARGPRRRPDQVGGPGRIGIVLRQQRPCAGTDRSPADAADPDRRARRGNQPVHRHQRCRDAGPAGQFAGAGTASSCESPGTSDSSGTSCGARFPKRSTTRFSGPSTRRSTPRRINSRIGFRSSATGSVSRAHRRADVAVAPHRARRRDSRRPGAGLRCPGRPVRRPATAVRPIPDCRSTGRGSWRRGSSR